MENGQGPARTEIVDQWVILSGILSGFALGTFVELLSINDQRLIARLALCLVIVGGLLLLTSTVIASFARTCGSAESPSPGLVLGARRRR